MSKIIFLDIDGPLAWGTWFDGRINFNDDLSIPYPWVKEDCDALTSILKQTEANIVLSSDWKLHWNLDELKGIFTWNGVKKSPIAVTPNIVEKMSSDLEDERQFQIQTFKREHKPESWVAIDDLDLSFSLGDHFFKTKSGMGIKQTGLKEKIIKKLNNE